MLENEIPDDLYNDLSCPMYTLYSTPPDAHILFKAKRRQDTGEWQDVTISAQLDEELDNLLSVVDKMKLKALKKGDFTEYDKLMARIEQIHNEKEKLDNDNIY